MSESYARDSSREALCPQAHCWNATVIPRLTWHYIRHIDDTGDNLRKKVAQVVAAHELGKTQINSEVQGSSILFCGIVLLLYLKYNRRV